MTKTNVKRSRRSNGRLRIVVKVFSRIPTNPRKQPMDQVSKKTELVFMKIKWIKDSNSNLGLLTLAFLLHEV